MNYVYKIIGIISFWGLCLNNLFATEQREVGTNAIKFNMAPREDNTIVNGLTGNEGYGILDALLKFIKDSVFDLLLLIGVGVFLYIGIRLVIARGNEEEFKKAMMHFIYAVVGIFVVSASWAAVKLITGISF